MVLPLTILKTAQSQPMMVELKNGETYSGILASCDGFMNLHMRDIVCTTRDGDRFWKISECYIRGNNIKYLRFPDEVIDMVKEEPKRDRHGGSSGLMQGSHGRGRGITEGRGRGSLRGRGRGSDIGFFREGGQMGARKGGGRGFRGRQGGI